MRDVLVGTGPHLLTKTWFRNGTATDVGDITVGVVDANGTEVVAPLTATTNNADGTYEYNLPRQDTQTVLIITWTATNETQVDLIEVVGSRLYTEAQLRAFDNNALTSETDYPDDAIVQDRYEVQTLLEHHTGRAWNKRYARVEMAGTASTMLRVGDGVSRLSTGRLLNNPGRGYDINEVLSVTINGTSVATSNFVVDRSVLHRTNGTWPRSSTANPLNVVVEYTYGLSYPFDGSDRIAMLLSRWRLAPGAITSRTLSLSNDLGQHTIAQPGSKWPTGIPEVDQWVDAHRVLPAVV